MINVQYLHLAKYYRIQVSHPDDLGKTRVRMKKTDMQDLGLREGEIVKITGGRVAHAFCHGEEGGYHGQNEKEFVCLDEPSKRVHEIRISDETYANLQNYHFGNLVLVEKSDAVRADSIVVRPLYGTGNGTRYDLKWLQEPVVVSREDRILGRGSDPGKPRGFFVMDGTPESQAWIVGRDTPVQISDKPGTTVPRMINDPGELRSVIPVVQKITGDDFEATISAVEIYDNCMKVMMYVKDVIVTREQFSSGLCAPTIMGHDDLGNRYVLNRYAGRGGGSFFGDVIWGSTKKVNFTEVSSILVPAPNGRARELTLSVLQLLWDIVIRPGPQMARPAEQEKKITMTPVSRLGQKYVIHGGPWEIKIRLDEK